MHGRGIGRCDGLREGEDGDLVGVDGAAGLAFDGQLPFLALEGCGRIVLNLLGLFLLFLLPILSFLLKCFQLHGTAGLGDDVQSVCFPDQLVQGVGVEIRESDGHRVGVGDGSVGDPVRDGIAFCRRLNDENAVVVEVQTLDARQGIGGSREEGSERLRQVALRLQQVTVLTLLEERSQHDVVGVEVGVVNGLDAVVVGGVAPDGV